MRSLRDRSLAIVVAIAFTVALALSTAHGTPAKLPGIALGWRLLLHVERAAAAAVVVAVGAVVLLQLWQGRLPTKLPGGVEFGERADLAADRVVREQLLRVERESKAAFDELRQTVQQLAAGRTDTTFESVARAASRWEGCSPHCRRERRDCERDQRVARAAELVVALRYFENLPLDEIALVLGADDAQVSELHKQALGTLRAQLGSDPFPDADQ